MDTSGALHEGPPVDEAIKEQRIFASLEDAREAAKTAPPDKPMLVQLTREEHAQLTHIRDHRARLERLEELRARPHMSRGSRKRRRRR